MAIKQQFLIRILSWELNLNWYLIKEQELIEKLREGKLGPKMEIVAKGKHVSKDSDIEVNTSIAILFALHSISLAFLIYYFAILIGLFWCVERYNDNSRV